MAGENKTNPNLSSTTPLPSPQGNNVVCLRSHEISVLTTEMELADTVNLILLPDNFCVIGGFLTLTDMDTGGPTLAVDVGDATDPNGFLAASTVGGGGGTVCFGDGAIAAYMRDGYTTTAETQIILTVETAATTPAAGSIFCVIYGIHGGAVA